ncbi:hypothetical protein C8R11_102283 [Nitrosomonas aestuarii]|nr:hypothetical protein C8R11_102283 [Nitrosomonas aestuarii]
MGCQDGMDELLRILAITLSRKLLRPGIVSGYVKQQQIALYLNLLYFSTQAIYDLKTLL